jgi:hypothetical protein
MSKNVEPAGSSRRFDVELFITHPTLRPIDIEQALALSASHSHCVGDPRVTPTGKSLSGKYPDTRWRHSIHHTTTAQSFMAEVDALVARLQPHEAFLMSVRETGGSATLIIQFLGDGYFGDELPVSTLSDLAKLGVGLGIEVFADAQN